MSNLHYTTFQHSHLVGLKSDNYITPIKSLCSCLSPATPHPKLQLLLLEMLPYIQSYVEDNATLLLLQFTPTPNKVKDIACCWSTFINVTPVVCILPNNSNMDFQSFHCNGLHNLGSYKVPINRLYCHSMMWPWFTQIGLLLPWFKQCQFLYKP